MVIEGGGMMLLMAKENRWHGRAHLAGQTDPVCALEVTPIDAHAKVEYKGKTYFFCSRICKAVFERDPDRFAAVHPIS